MEAKGDDMPCCPAQFIVAGLREDNVPAMFAFGCGFMTIGAYTATDSVAMTVSTRVLSWMEVLELLCPILPRGFGKGQHLNLFCQRFNGNGYPSDSLYSEKQMDIYFYPEFLS
jgi:hypothetical protein